MVNEEIVTALRNAVEHGESLQDAMQIMMNSGYSPLEVQEASGYVSGSSLNLQQVKPEENLVMPSQKSRIAFWKNQKPVQQPLAQQPQTLQINSYQQAPQVRQTQQPIQQNQFQQQNPMQFQQQVQQQSPMQVQQQAQQQAQRNQFQQQNPMQFQQQVQQKILPVEQVNLQQPYNPQVLQSVPLAKQLEEIKPPRPSYTKEIVLVFILLVLIGVLIFTILKKDVIMSWFA